MRDFLINKVGRESVCEATMNKLIVKIQNAVALTALVAAPALALTTSAQAAPLHHNYVAAHSVDIIGSRNPAIYDGPHYGQIQKVQFGQLQVSRFARQNVRVTSHTTAPHSSKQCR